ncbi:MAG TPA: type VII secretion integral membrane protein EccD [Streptosporangiaceae bacterium]
MIATPAPIGADVCRVTIIGPHRQADVALPANVPLADLFPTVAEYAGVDRATAAQAPGGWVLQKLGQAPFPPQATPAQAGLADGDLLYLRPAAAALSPPVSDDIADAIAGLHGKAGRWQTADARLAGQAAGAVLLVAGVIVIGRSGPPWPVPTAIATAVTVVLLLASIVVSRAAGDHGTGAVLGCGALPYAFLAGLAGPAGRAPLMHAGTLGMLAGFAAFMAAAVVAAAGVEGGLTVFFGPVVAAMAGVAGAWLAYAVSGVGAAGAAAVVVTVALALTPAIPVLAFRIARLRLPPIPATAADLRDDALLAPRADTTDRAVAADKVVTGAASALGLIATSGEIALGRGGVLDSMTAGVLACALLLRSRLFRGRAQRLWLMAPGYGGLAWMAVATAERGMRGSYLTLTVLVVVAGALLVIGVGSWLPRQRPSPFWGRAADVVDMLLVIGLIPLTLAAAGVFGRVHGLGG